VCARARARASRTLGKLFTEKFGGTPEQIDFELCWLCSSLSRSKPVGVNINIVGAVENKNVCKRLKGE
jgi:hypothetical protein